MKRHNYNRPRFGGIVNNGPKPLYFVHLGQRFELPEALPGHHYVRAPNNKLVRRMERRNIMMHRKPMGNSVMHKITKFRRELVALMPKPGRHPHEKRAEKRRRIEAQKSVAIGSPVIIDSKIPHHDALRAALVATSR